MPRLLTIKRKHFHSDKIPARRRSCSRCEKRRRRFERYSNREKTNAVGDTAGRSRDLRHRSEAPGAAAEEEDGAGGARTAHRAISGDAVEDRTGAALPDAADAAADSA